ncbi:MAG TPA: tetratricopeptide repeat protein [Burkholderiales bacterium]|nr:tetratricopeptide repeat protein [Burkholderiales bacterium]
MSLINRMLQDLDRRQALETADAGVVRASAARPASREWFWRVLVVLLTVALAWMGWVAIQLLPRKPLATDLAFVAASEARARPPAKPAAPPVAEAAAPAPIAAPVPETPPVVAAALVAPSSDALRLATELQTPIIEKPIEPPKPAAATTKPKATAPAPKPAAKPSVDKRERMRSANDNAEGHFRRAALLLNHGRVSEAEEQLVAALQVDPRHGAARQAYVSLLLEQQRVSTARRVLQEALVLEPAQPAFALALARIHAAERDYAAALAVLDRAAPVGHGAADFQAFRGAMLQRLGRHDEALVAYQNAVRDGTPPATAWIGYAISLEAVGKRSEAAQAYRRALTVGLLAAEARDYAESRARALE